VCAVRSFKLLLRILALYSISENGNVCMLVHSYLAGPGEEGNRVVIQVCLFFSRGCLLLQLL